jgi:carnitine-CoA ligase
VAAGEIGELWVRPQDPRLVMRGYHNLPDKTAETLVDGWVHTGDAFRVDADGRFFFADRMKDALRRRGENVSSFEVERVINEYPAVFESAVVGVPAELTEDEIKAVVVVREGRRVDPVELTRFLVDRLPYFMVPRYLEFVAELPSAEARCTSSSCWLRPGTSKSRSSATEPVPWRCSATVTAACNGAGRS